MLPEGCALLTCMQVSGHMAQTRFPSLCLLAVCMEVGLMSASDGVPRKDMAGHQCGKTTGDMGLQWLARVQLKCGGPTLVCLTIDWRRIGFDML